MSPREPAPAGGSAVVEVEEGAARRSNFARGPGGYPLLRIDEAPKIEGYFVDGAATPYGLGKPPLPRVAPAVLNAVCDATGRRLRSLPLLRRFT